jgi:hypothetical protein
VPPLETVAQSDFYFLSNVRTPDTRIKSFFLFKNLNTAFSKIKIMLEIIQNWTVIWTLKGSGVSLFTIINRVVNPD